MSQFSALLELTDRHPSYHSLRGDHFYQQDLTGFDANQATRNGKSLTAELELLTVHGILHLCGFDHAEPDEERAMQARTNELLARWRAGERP